MSTDSDVIVKASHYYSHSAEKVFDAWLDPGIAARFLFSKATGEMVQCEIDPNVGGRFVLTDRRDGEEIEHTGEYLEIDRPHRLRFTFGIPAVSDDVDIITIQITPTDAGCELILTAEMKPDWAAYAEASRDAWAKMLHSLERALD